MTVPHGDVSGYDPSSAIDQAELIYSQSVARLRESVLAFGRDGSLPDAEARAAGAFAYPELVVTYSPSEVHPYISSAFGKFAAPGVYRATLTRPEFFRPYLEEQLGLLIERYGDAVRLDVRASPEEIPYPYVLEKSDQMALSAVAPRDLSRFFPAPELEQITDSVADGDASIFSNGDRALALFDAQRVDYSLHRLSHYTGTAAGDFQDYVLFTNYTLYVEEFAAWAMAQARDPGSPYSAFAVPGGGRIDGDTADPDAVMAAAPWRKFQMPAYHLVGKNRSGITLVNIGVGPSNAKTMTDHLAVLRPQCWLMIGHCGGLRDAQRLGDYVLAHAYLRRDAVLDRHLPLEVPVPAIAEVQVALQEAAAHITGETGEALKSRLRTGTIVTNADRNWELSAGPEMRVFNKSRAIAVDMESATIAANGFRLRVPYGSLLCVSDKPLHGELKLPGPARRFYEQAVAQHLQIGIKAMEILSQDGGAALHSRKLRAFDEPPFR